MQPGDRERLLDLAAWRATEELSTEDAALWERLSAAEGAAAEREAEAFARAAAAVDLALTARHGTQLEPLPAALRARLATTAGRWPAPPSSAAVKSPQRGPRSEPLAPLAAAAAALVAAALWFGERRAGERLQLEFERATARTAAVDEELRARGAELVATRQELDRARAAREAAEAAQRELSTAAEASAGEVRELNQQLAAANRRHAEAEAQLLERLAALEEQLYQPSAEVRLERLLARADDVVRVPWRVLEDPLVQGLPVGGEVIWSDAEQEGYMVFDTMRSNAELAHQYQLWIFDQTQRPETPVDGGVFDVAASAERLVIPIDAKLRVERPALFAVTLERPGGVVVSDRERLLLTAEVPSGR